MANLTLI